MNQDALKYPPSSSLFFALFCVLFCVIFNYTLSLMAAPYIVADLGGSNDINTYSVSFFALGNALGVPLGRGLLAQIRPARFLIIVLLLFTFFSWVCAISPNNPFFNVARFFQGFVGGGLSMRWHLFLLGSLQPKEKKGLFICVFLTLFPVTPVLGACWGGVVAYLWEWRWAFYFNIPFLLLLTWYLHYRLKGFDDQPIGEHSFDTVGYLTFFIGVFCLSSAVILGQELDWFRSNLITALVVIGLPSLLFFIFWELNHPHPILCLKLLKRPLLSFALFNLSVLFSAYFGMVVLLSLWLKLWANYTPDWIAALLGIMVLTALFPIFFLSTRISRIDDRIFLGLAILLLSISCFYTTVFSVDIDLKRIVISRLLGGLGLAFFLPPIFRLCFLNVPSADTLPILGLFQVFRGLSSGLGASIYATVWLRRQVFFHDRLGSKITIASTETQEFFSNAKQLGLTGDHANAQLEYYLERQATALALDDSFYLMAWILMSLLLTFVFTFFSKRTRPHVN